MRPFLLALALSIAAHLWLLFTPRIHFSFDEHAATTVIEARLANTPPPAVVAAAKTRPAAPPKRRLPEPQSVPPPQTTPAPETPAPPVEEAAAPPEPAQPEEEAPTETPQPAPPDPAGHMPALAEIAFALHKGEDGLKVGKVVHTWQIVNDGYVISSVTEATGIFSWIKPGRLVQTSQGRLSARGLEPEYFWIQRGQSADTTESAQFDRRNNTLTYGSGAERRAVPLPDRAQDLLSFVYQLAFNAPQTGAIQLFITNGRKLDSYDYGVVSEETLDTPLGKLKTLHLRKIRSAGEDGVDIWLGTDYRYLPVKVRLTDKDGDSVEQVASEVRLQ
jgi:hypothetical protein